jgi:hypothetical protein
VLGEEADVAAGRRPGLRVEALPRLDLLVLFYQSLPRSFCGKKNINKIIDGGAQDFYISVEE